MARLAGEVVGGSAVGCAGVDGRAAGLQVGVEAVQGAVHQAGGEVAQVVVARAGGHVAEAGAVDQRIIHHERIRRHGWAGLVIVPGETGGVARREKDRLALEEVVAQQHLLAAIAGLVEGASGDQQAAALPGDRRVDHPNVPTGVEVEGQGLEPGMNVVTVGAYGLPGRTRIRVVGH